MDDKMKEGMESNMLTYKRDMDRITSKYSQYQDDVNIDLNETSYKVYCSRIRKAEGQLKMSLTNTSSIDFGEESLRAQDTSDTQQWDNTLQEGEADETHLGSNHSVQHEVTGVSGMNNTQRSRSFLDETWGSLQPEDQDEELEKTLSSHTTSLVELYPRMIHQLSKAVYSQQVFDAADSVLRKYRRQRFPPNASHLNHTLDVSLRAPDLRNPKKNKGKVVRKRSPNCSLLMNITPGKTREVVNQSYLHDVANQQDQQTEIGCREKKADPVESKYRPDVLIHPFFITKILQRQQHLAPLESPHQRDQPTGRSGRLTIDGFRSQSPRSWREVIHPLPTCNAAYEKDSFTVTDGSAVFSSPVRRSPFNTWLRNLESPSGMSQALSQRPKSDTAGSPSRHLGESRSRSPSPFASPQKHSKHSGESRSASLLSFTVTDGSAVFSSPVRQSPFKAWLKNVESQSGMSHALSQSPKSDTAGSPSRHLAESRSRSASPFASPQKYSKHPGESRSRSASPLSSPQKSIMSPTKHHYYSPSQPKVNLCQSPSRIHKLHTAQRQSHGRHPALTSSRSETTHSSLQKLTMSPRKHHHCSDSPSQTKIYSGQSTTGTGRSLDISTCHDSSSSIRYSPKKIDMEFQRVYHRSVCLGKPVPLGPLCSVCTMHMDANRDMSALALPHSTHRSRLRKRHRELDSESPHSSSKRFRGRCDVNSPGSHRHLKKTLKQQATWRSTGLITTQIPTLISHNNTTLAWAPGPQLQSCQERWVTG